jgi:hypothetical protein
MAFRASIVRDADLKNNMHSFDELIQHCTEFSLEALGEAQQKVVEALQTSSATSLVKALQMVQLQRVISAVGMFSMFDAILQDGLQCADGFRMAGELLEKQGAVALTERFGDLQLAINVLKHGRGRSYDALVQKARALPFRIKLPDEYFFNEGDVSEVSTLVEVDDAFLRSCAEVIREVSAALKGAGQNFNT